MFNCCWAGTLSLEHHYCLQRNQRVNVFERNPQKGVKTNLAMQGNKKAKGQLPIQINSIGNERKARELLPQQGEKIASFLTDGDIGQTNFHPRYELPTVCDLQKMRLKMPSCASAHYILSMIKYFMMLLIQLDTRGSTCYYEVCESPTGSLTGGARRARAWRRRWRRGTGCPLGWG